MRGRAVHDVNAPRRVAGVTIDRLKCFSQERCVDIAPQVFSLDAEAISTVGDISLTDDATLLSAARACPMQAISIWGSNANQLYPETETQW